MNKNDVVRTYNWMLLSLKKSELMLFTATKMGLEIIILSEVSQNEEGKYYMISLTYRI